MRGPKLDMDAHWRAAVLRPTLPDGLQDASERTLGKECVCVTGAVSDLDMSAHAPRQPLFKH